MKIVLSPAKALDYTTPALDVPASLPAFLEQTHALVDILRGYDEVALSGLMSISAALSRENVARLCCWVSTSVNRVVDHLGGRVWP